MTMYLCVQEEAEAEYKKLHPDFAAAWSDIPGLADDDPTAMDHDSPPPTSNPEDSDEQGGAIRDAPMQMRDAHIFRH